MSLDARTHSGQAKKTEFHTSVFENNSLFDQC